MCPSSARARCGANGDAEVEVDKGARAKSDGARQADEGRQECGGLNREIGEKKNINGKRKKKIKAL